MCVEHISDLKVGDSLTYTDISLDKRITLKQHGKSVIKLMKSISHLICQINLESNSLQCHVLKFVIPGGRF